MQSSPTLSKSLRILAVDSDPLARRGAKDLLRRQFAWIVQSAPGGAHLVTICRDYQPHLALVGVCGPQPCDIKNIHLLKSSQVCVLAYGRVESVGGLRKLIAAGTDGFIHCSLGENRLLNAVRECVQGRRSVLMGNETELLLALLGSSRKRPVALTTNETRRALEILSCIVKGMSNAEIAEHLAISVGTVKAHIGQLLRRHGFSSRTQLAVYASKLGLS